MKPNRKEAAEILRGARDPSKAGLWRASPDESQADHIERLVRLETAADQIQAWSPLLMPGMLQSYQYAVAAISTTAPALPIEDVADRADKRQQRINALGFASDRRAWFIVSEQAIRCPIGGFAVLVEQLEHLLNVVALRPSVTVQVLPASTPGHPGLTGGFTTYRIGSQRAVFSETLTGSVITNRPSDIAAYAAAYDHLQASALPVAASLEMIDTARRTLCTEESNIWSG
ncbi:hypothetical protein GCM10011583_53170 [Streptomyces camponoticapitis]|uniref:DUF5753 domain-containing protein n=1 Tax=Streptomyces camponoticapitis TaxID=1616125 RepID=A0ABQ2EJK7_9ACTN|nr:DUF5753 domain-containing protein [Streptomyces camponoticapitis]GGK14572.1 hypothetical protein GCM10011583_53170 [Streptomyces camponoticapitis]